MVQNIFRRGCIVWVGSYTNQQLCYTRRFFKNRLIEPSPNPSLKGEGLKKSKIEGGFILKECAVVPPRKGGIEGGLCAADFHNTDTCAINTSDTSHTDRADPRYCR